jgi:cyclic pyranopterin phosphate synthase
MTDLNHFDSDGRSRMVDIGDKPLTRRTARASALVHLANATADLIKNRKIYKGDVLETARLAGIMASKLTPQLIPMCHPLLLDSVEMELEFIEASDPNFQRLRIEAVVKSSGKTGVEMEALMCVSIAALTVYDMCKSADREIEIGQIKLEEKLGGKSGHFVRNKI